MIFLRGWDVDRGTGSYTTSSSAGNIWIVENKIIMYINSCAEYLHIQETEDRVIVRVKET